MILAAGLGTRLRPLTNDRPKALVTLARRTLLEVTIDRLRRAGIREMIVNVHHFADAVVRYLQEHDNFGVHIEVSREETLLDTGGGLQKAAPFLLQPGNEPFLLHNVDVISTIDLAAMIRFQQAQQALAVLAVQQRATSRPLLFDSASQLRGRGGAPTDRTGTDEALAAIACGPLHSFAFTGIHVISPRIFALMHEEGPFSIIDAYLRLAGEGERILGFDASASAWRDLGRPEHLVQAEAEIRQGRFGPV